MKNNTIIQTIMLGLASAMLTGCLSVHKVTVKDAPRRNVKFESADAMCTFYETLLAERFPTGGKPSRVRFGNTLYTWETRPSADVVFNEGVTMADSDGDGLVSVSEADRFATSSGR